MYELPLELRNELDHQARLAYLRSGHDIALLLENSVGRTVSQDDMRRHRQGLPPRAIVATDLEHVSDWLVASIEADVKWLRNIGEGGVPRKFAKFSTFDDIAAEARRGMDRLMVNVAQAGPDDCVEVILETLPNGFSIVELKSAAALDRESARMQHCVGLGGYDQGIADGTISILSLRDQKGRPHATMEIVNDEAYVQQVKGKQNRFPVDRYFDMLVPWLRERGLAVNGRELAGGYFADRDGRLRHVSDLEEGERLEMDLVIRVNDRDRKISLPRGLRINGDLSVLCERGGEAAVSIGRDVWVGNGAMFSKCRVSGLQNLDARMQLKLADVVVENLSPGNTFRSSVVVEEMTDGLTPFLNGHRFEDGLRVDACGDVVILPSVNVGDILTIGAAKSVTIRAGTRIECDLTVSDEAGRVFLDVGHRDTKLFVEHDVTVEGDLVMKGGEATFADGLTVGGTLIGMNSTIRALPFRSRVGSLVMNTVPDLNSVPDDLMIDADATFLKTGIRDLSNRPRWNGDLRVIKAGQLTLPSALHVERHLELGEARLDGFPRWMSVGGGLTARHCTGCHIHDGTYIGGYLSLVKSSDVRIPQGFHVPGDLNLENASIPFLPIGVTVDGAVHLAGIVVDGVSRHFKARSYALEGAIVMDMSDLADIEGNLWISAYDVKHMPQDCTIGGRMVVKGTTEGLTLPRGLSVGKALVGFDAATVAALKESGAKVGTIRDHGTHCR
jgi:hypothetical protein